MTFKKITKQAIIEQLLANAYILEIDRYSDTPLNPQDRVLYADAAGGWVLVARAPLPVTHNETHLQRPSRPTIAAWV